MTLRLYLTILVGIWLVTAVLVVVNDLAQDFSKWPCGGERLWRYAANAAIYVSLTSWTSLLIALAVVYIIP